MSAKSSNWTVFLNFVLNFHMTSVSATDVCKRHKTKKRLGGQRELLPCASWGALPALGAQGSQQTPPALVEGKKAAEWKSPAHTF